MAIEFARNVLKIADASSEEFTPEGVVIQSEGIVFPLEVRAIIVRFEVRPQLFEFRPQPVDRERVQDVDIGAVQSRREDLRGFGHYLRTASNKHES